MSAGTPEIESPKYVEALLRIEATVWAVCEEIAADLDLSANEVIAIAITDMHSRLMNVREGRLLISVDAADARFYTSSLEAHLAEADPVYAEVLNHLTGLPIGGDISAGEDE
jgi:hypothetical protein